MFNCQSKSQHMHTHAHTQAHTHTDASLVASKKITVLEILKFIRCHRRSTLHQPLQSVIITLFIFPEHATFLFISNLQVCFSFRLECHNSPHSPFVNIFKTQPILLKHGPLTLPGGIHHHKVVTKKPGL